MLENILQLHQLQLPGRSFEKLLTESMLRCKLNQVST